MNVNPADTLLLLPSSLSSASPAARHAGSSSCGPGRTDGAVAPTLVAGSLRSAKETHVTQHIRLPATLLLAACKRDSVSHGEVCDDNRSLAAEQAASRLLLAGVQYELRAGQTVGLTHLQASKHRHFAANEAFQGSY